nr:hypothetical protein [uncultured Psychroserpens sp.]
MSLSKILGTFLVLLSVIFLGLQFKGLEIEASGVRALAMITLSILYAIKIKNKHPLFLMFLLFFSLAEVFNFITWVIDFDSNSNIEYTYYIGNGLYILSYAFLIVRIVSTINMSKALLKFPLQSLSLLILGVFVVSLVTDTTIDELTTPQYIMEFVYNAVIMVLLSFSLLNYMIKDDKKAMNLLIGSIFILFSEVIQLAYFYIADFNILNVLCSLFLVIAFLFYYLQSRLKYDVTGKQINHQQEINA